MLAADSGPPRSGNGTRAGLSVTPGESPSVITLKTGEVTISYATRS